MLKKCWLYESFALCLRLMLGINSFQKLTRERYSSLILVNSHNVYCRSTTSCSVISDIKLITQLQELVYCIYLQNFWRAVNFCMILHMLFQCNRSLSSKRHQISMRYVVMYHFVIAKISYCGGRMRTSTSQGAGLESLNWSRGWLMYFEARIINVMALMNMMNTDVFHSKLF